MEVPKEGPQGRAGRVLQGPEEAAPLRRRHCRGLGSPAARAARAAPALVAAVEAVLRDTEPDGPAGARVLLPFLVAFAAHARDVVPVGPRPEVQAVRGQFQH